MAKTWRGSIVDIQNCSIEELKEWLKQPALGPLTTAYCSIEELKEWLKRKRS